MLNIPQVNNIMSVTSKTRKLVICNITYRTLSCLGLYKGTALKQMPRHCTLNLKQNIDGFQNIFRNLYTINRDTAYPSRLPHPRSLIRVSALSTLLVDKKNDLQVDCEYAQQADLSLHWPHIQSCRKYRTPVHSYIRKVIGRPYPEHFQKCL